MFELECHLRPLLGEITPKQFSSLVRSTLYKSISCGFSRDLQVERAFMRKELGVRLRNNVHLEHGSLNKPGYYFQYHITMNTNDSTTSIFCSAVRESGAQDPKVLVWSQFPSDHSVNNHAV